MKNKSSYLVVEKHYLNGEDFTDILGVFETIEEAEKCCRDRINTNQINEEDLTDGRFIWFANKNFTRDELIGELYCSYLGIGKDNEQAIATVDVIVEDYSLKIEELDSRIEIFKEDN